MFPERSTISVSIHKHSSSQAFLVQTTVREHCDIGLIRAMVHERAGSACLSSMVQTTVCEHGGIGLIRTTLHGRSGAWVSFVLQTLV